jgi:hypothetical protein
VLTCSPPFPGGRFFASVPAFWRDSSDSNGSRRAILVCSAVELPLVPSGEFVAACFFATGFDAGFAAGSDAGFTAGFDAGVPAGRAAAGFGAGAVAGGCPCACEHVAPAVSKIAVTTVITERIVRSFPLRAFQPLQAEFWLQLWELHSHQQAW